MRVCVTTTSDYVCARMTENSFRGEAEEHEMNTIASVVNEHTK